MGIVRRQMKSSYSSCCRVANGALQRGKMVAQYLKKLTAFLYASLGIKIVIMISQMSFKQWMRIRHASDVVNLRQCRQWPYRAFGIHTQSPFSASLCHDYSRYRCWFTAQRRRPWTTDELMSANSRRGTKRWRKWRHGLRDTWPGCAHLGACAFKSALSAEGRQRLRACIFVLWRADVRVLSYSAWWGDTEFAVRWKSRIR